MSRHPALRPRTLIGWLVVAAALFALPTLQRTLGFAVYNLIFLYFVFFWVTQATSWNLFSGYSGYFSFGQAAFYGAGLYVTANMTVRYGTGLLAALPVAAAIAAAIALVSGVLVFRLRKLSGEIFALFTLAVALALGALANNWGFIDGGRGIPIGSVDYPSWLGSTTEMLYYLGLTLALISVFIAFAVQHSRFGFGLFTIRDDERVAESIGVPTFRYKLGIFTLNGVIAGVSGALHAVQVNFISPAGAFEIRVALFVILMSVVGGRRHWLGPVLGAVLIHTVSDRLVGAGMAELNQVILALMLIAATLFLRGGIISRLVERPLAALAVFVVAALAQVALWDTAIITVAAYAMVAALLVLLLPDRLFDSVPALWRRSVPTEADAELQADDRPVEEEQVL